MTEIRALPTDRKARIAVLDDYMGVAHDVADWNILRDRAEVVFLTNPFRDADDMVAQLQPFDAICLLRERSALPADVLRRLPTLKAIAATGKRNRTLDHVTARTLGITVMATKGSGNGALATAELAWGLIIGLMRHIPDEANGMRNGGWQTRLGNALYGRTLGLVGLGKLGAHMAQIGRAFGMKVLAWSPNLTVERAQAGGAELADKETLLRQSDIVSLHLVLGAGTRGVIGRDELALMGPDAILINTSRGPLVDEPALIAALQAGTIRAAGLDVFEHEPLPSDHPLRSLPNALLTPHLGYTVRETLERFYGESVENLNGWLNGQPIRLYESDG